MLEWSGQLDRYQVSALYWPVWMISWAKWMPHPDSSVFGIGVVYYQVLQIDLNIWGNLGQAIFYQARITGKLSDEVWLFLANMMHRQEVSVRLAVVAESEWTTFWFGISSTFKCVTESWCLLNVSEWIKPVSLIISSIFPLFLLFGKML